MASEMTGGSPAADPLLDTEVSCTEV